MCGEPIISNKMDQVLIRIKLSHQDRGGLPIKPVNGKLETPSFLFVYSTLWELLTMNINSHPIKKVMEAVSSQGGW